MIQSKKFDNLMTENVPFANYNQVNLLRTTDLSVRDQANLIKSGMGDLLHHPTAQIMSSSIVKDKLDMEVEERDALKAQNIQLKFVSYRTPVGNLRKIP